MKRLEERYGPTGYEGRLFSRRIKLLGLAVIGLVCLVMAGVALLSPWH